MDQKTWVSYERLPPLDHREGFLMEVLDLRSKGAKGSKRGTKHKSCPNPSERFHGPRRKTTVTVQNYFFESSFYKWKSEEGKKGSYC